MPEPFPCPRCRDDVPPSIDYCLRCNQRVPPPNVRTAEATREIAALQKRYRKSVSDAADRKAIQSLRRFETMLQKDSRAVIARTPADLFVLVLSTHQTLSRYHELARTEIRVPKGELWDRRRQEADAALFTGYEDKLHFAALTLDGQGLTNYGSCSIVLRATDIADRASAMVMNSVLLKEKYPGRQSSPNRIPLGYRSNWEARFKLSIAKLGKKIGRGTRKDRFPGILLRRGADTADDEFIEVQIWGPVTVKAVQTVTFDTVTFEEDVIRRCAIEERLAPFGVEVNS